MLSICITCVYFEVMTGGLVTCGGHSFVRESHLVRISVHKDADSDEGSLLSCAQVERPRTPCTLFRCKAYYLKRITFV